MVTSILTSVLTVSYLSADTFAAKSGVAKSPAIGVVTASGHFVLDRSEVWGNATLFDGGKIETGVASSEAALRNGVRIQLASASSATVGESQLTLTKGTGQVAATEDYQVTAGGLAIRSASGASRVRVAWLAGGSVEVTALSGAARVASRTGLVLASIPAGRRMDFAMQAAAGVVTRTGCLLSKDGRFLLQDQNTQEVLEIRGNDLAAQVGNRVTITGAASAIRPALTIASGLVECNYRDAAGNRRLLERGRGAGRADRANERRCRDRPESARGRTREGSSLDSQKRHVNGSQGRHRRSGRRRWSGSGDRVSRRQEIHQPVGLRS